MVNDSSLKTQYNLANTYCHWEYLATYREELKTLYTFKPDYYANALRSIEDQLKRNGLERENITLISIHVRRTDVHYLIKHPPSTEYYGKAMEYFSQK